MKNITPAVTHVLSELIETEAGVVGSRTLAQEDSFSLTIFGFGTGEGISEFTVPGDTFIYIISGEASVTVNSTENHRLEDGQCLLIASEQLYSLKAESNLKIMIMLVK